MHDHLFTYLYGVAHLQNLTNLSSKKIDCMGSEERHISKKLDKLERRTQKAISTVKWAVFTIFFVYVCVCVCVCVRACKSWYYELLYWTSCHVQETSTNKRKIRQKKLTLLVTPRLQTLINYHHHIICNTHTTDLSIMYNVSQSLYSLHASI